MRSFIALELPEVFSYETAMLARQISRQVQGRFMKRDTYHLTLAFLGDASDSDIMEAVCVLDALEGSGSVSLEIDGLGKFGRASDATLWLGLRPDEELMLLAERVRDGLEAAGVAFDRKSFKPHITLARRARLGKADLQGLPFPQDNRACRLTLFKSALTSSGAIYKPIHSVGLEER